MKILLIDNFFYRRGGAEVVFLNTGELLTAKGHNVSYFSRKWDKNLATPYEKYFCEGLDLHSKGYRNKLKELVNFFYNREASKKLEKLIIDEKPDIAHIHLFFGGISPSIFKILKKYNIPIVHTVHDYRMVCPAYTFKDGHNKICERCKGQKFYQCFFHKCSKGNYLLSFIMTLEMYFRNLFLNPVKNIDSFMFVSKFAYDIHLKYNNFFSKRECTVMYNFQDESVIKEVDRNIKTFQGKYLFFGRLSYEKGIKTLIQAFAQRPNLSLNIIGTGPLKEDFENYCNENNIKNINFLGFKSGSELFQLIKKSKFVCVPSEWYENNPMTIIEAYTLRVPVIGSRIGGISEIIVTDQTGYLFEAGNIKSLLAVIDKAESLDQKQYEEMKSKAEEFAEEHFNKEIYYKKLITLYNHTINSYKHKQL